MRPSSTAPPLTLEERRLYDSVRVVISAYTTGKRMSSSVLRSSIGLLLTASFAFVPTAVAAEELTGFGIDSAEAVEEYVARPASPSESDVGEAQAEDDSRSMVQSDYTITHQWNDPEGNLIRLRRHFHTKLQQHNLAILSAGSVVSNVRRQFQGGTNYIYAAEAVRRLCDSTTCVETEVIPVWVLYDARRVDDVALGIFNGYCRLPNNAQLCPTWVSGALLNFQ